MKSARFMLWLLILLPVSCASDSGASKPSAPAPAEATKPLSQRLQENNGYQQDADGNWVPKSDKRSSFDRQGASPYFTGQYGKKTYKTGEFSKKSRCGPGGECDPA